MSGGHWKLHDGMSWWVRERHVWERTYMSTCMLSTEHSVAGPCNFWHWANGYQKSCGVYVGTAIVTWNKYFEEHSIRFYKIFC